MDTLFFIFKILTFPGTVLRATAQLLCARHLVIETENANPFSKGVFCGHINHLPTVNKCEAKKICLRPMLACLFIGTLIIVPSSVGIFFSGEYRLSIPLLYVGLSILCNIFPAESDAAKYSEFSGAGKMTRLFLFGAKLEKSCLNLFTSIAWSAIISGVVCILFYIAV